MATTEERKKEFMETGADASKWLIQDLSRKIRAKGLEVTDDGITIKVNVSYKFEPDKFRESGFWQLGRIGGSPFEYISEPVERYFLENGVYGRQDQFSSATFRKTFENESYNGVELILVRQ